MSLQFDTGSNRTSLLDDNFDIDNRNGTTGYSFDNFYNGVGLGFGNFNDNLNGLNFTDGICCVNCRQ